MAKLLKDSTVGEKQIATVDDVSGKADENYVDEKVERVVEDLNKLHDKVKAEVPLDAKFTDTIYTAGDNISIVDEEISVTGQLGLTEEDVTIIVNKAIGDIDSVLDAINGEVI